MLLFAVLAASAWSDLPHEDASDEGVAVAKKTLSEKFGVDASELELISVKAVEWRGSGVQCQDSPEGPVVAGYAVRLKIGTNCFEVRVADEEARICGFRGKSQLMTPGTIEPELQDEVKAATVDLAARIKTTPAKVEILEAVSVVWRDSSMGCPKPGMDYLQVLTPGVRIRMRFGLHVFEYHGAAGRAPQYCEHPSDTKPLPGGPATE